LMRMGHSETAEFSTFNLVGMVLAVMISLLLSCWVVARLGRRSQRIVLE
jgi:preprotein translocase subunit SecF